MEFPLLQILRGWAAMLVVLVHVSYITSSRFHVPFAGDGFAMGNAGVDFFFVLSGFLICYLHRADIGNRARTGSYVRKRLIRIYPLYWVVTLLIVPVYFLVPGFGLGDEARPRVILESLLLLPVARAPILVVGWTLRFELLFYLAFALLIALPRRLATPLAGLAVAIGLAGITLSYDTPRETTHPLVAHLLAPQVAEFLLGCAAAHVVVRMRDADVPRALYATLLAAGLLGFGATALLPLDWMDLRTGRHALLYGVLSFVIVVAAALVDARGGLGDRIASSRSHRALVYLGGASYALYLTHGPVISPAFKLVAALGVTRPSSIIALTVAILLLTVAVACACYEWLERPALAALRRRFLPAATVAAARSPAPARDTEITASPFPAAVGEAGSA